MDRALVSRDSNNSGLAANSSVATSSSKPTYVSQSYQWDELRDRFAMLWPEMALDELMSVMEEDYGFRATKDQYKKKFTEWYNRGVLSRKNHKRREAVLKGKPKGLEDIPSPQDAVVTSHHKLPTPASTPGHHDVMLHIEQVAESATSSNVDTRVHIEDQLAAPVDPGQEYPRRSSALVTERQSKFHQLLSDLWGTYFDAQFDHADEIEVGEALRNMVEFLLDVAATDPSLSTVTTCPGDLKLLRRIVTRIRRYNTANEELWKRLDAAVPSEQGTAVHLDDRQSALTWDSLLRNPEGSHFSSVVPGLLSYCCQCGDGPYNRKVSVGCAFPGCIGHRFCQNCLVWFEK